MGKIDLGIAIATVGTRVGVVRIGHLGMNPSVSYSIERHRILRPDSGNTTGLSDIGAAIKKHVEIKRCHCAIGLCAEGQLHVDRMTKASS